MLPLDEIPIPMVSDLRVPVDINVGPRVCEHCNSNPENEVAIKKELYQTDIEKIGSSELVGKVKKRKVTGVFNLEKIQMNNLFVYRKVIYILVDLYFGNKTKRDMNGLFQLKNGWQL
jgi:hypothetical protein